MASWHVDLYGTVDNDKDAQDAVDDITEVAEGWGLTASIATPAPTPPKEATKEAPKTEAKPK